MVGDFGGDDGCHCVCLFWGSECWECFDEKVMLKKMERERERERQRVEVVEGASWGEWVGNKRGQFICSSKSVVRGI